MSSALAFFPPPLEFHLVSWRQRLRAAIERSGMKQSVVALDAGITPETLSRILTAGNQRPSLDTVARIAHAVHENVGWVLEEQGFMLSADELRRLREVVRFLDTAILKAPLPRTIVRAGSNALPLKGGRRGLPKRFAALGARRSYQVTDDSMRDDGILDGDTVYVEPLTALGEADGQLALVEVAGEAYVKRLEMRSGSLRLLSGNERYAPLPLHEPDVEFIGRVVALERVGG